jgi:hypothetical protein
MGSPVCCMALRNPLLYDFRGGSCPCPTTHGVRFAPCQTKERK